MRQIGKLLMGFGLAIALVAAAFVLVSRTGLPLGHLPADITYKWRNISFYFPLGTCVLLSVLLTAGSYVFSRLRR